jgi:hypothetical protein
MRRFERSYRMALSMVWVKYIKVNRSQKNTSLVTLAFNFWAGGAVTLSCTMCSESHCALRLRYVDWLSVLELLLQCAVV